MDDILYIIIGIVWLAVSIYQSQRKMKQKQQKAAQQKLEREEETDQTYEEQTPKKKSFIDQILEEMNKEEESTPYSEPVPPPPPPPPVRNKSENYYKNKSVENYMSRSDMPESESGLSGEYYEKSRIRKRDYRAFSQENKKEETTHFYDYDDEIDDFEFDFDLRNAVIYSEILNRPYT